MVRSRKKTRGGENEEKAPKLKYLLHPDLNSSLGISVLFVFYSFQVISFHISELRQWVKFWNYLLTRPSSPISSPLNLTSFLLARPAPPTFALSLHLQERPNLLWFSTSGLVHGVLVLPHSSCEKVRANIAERPQAGIGVHCGFRECPKYRNTGGHQSVLEYGHLGDRIYLRKFFLGG